MERGGPGRSRGPDHCTAEQGSVNSVSARTDERHANSATASTPSSEVLSARLRAADLDWIVPDWSAPSSVQAFFTTRNAGAGKNAVLDLGAGERPGIDGDSDGLRAESRRRVQAF